MQKQNCLKVRNSRPQDPANGSFITINSELVESKEMKSRELNFLTFKLSNFLTFLFLTSIFLLPIYGSFITTNSQVWGESLILRPIGDQVVGTGWAKYGCTNAYECIDEVTADDDATYLYESGWDNKFCAFVLNSTWATNIDSIVIHSRAKTDLTCTACFNVGWALWDSETHAWYWDDTNDTTVNLSTFWTTFHYKPSRSWTADEINNRRFGFGNNVIGEASIYVTQEEVVVYYTPSEGTNKQGGVVQDKDNRGIAEGGIAR
jgi:hypothetical protein